MRALEVVKAHYDANDRGDMAGMLAPLAEDIRWTEMEGFPCAGTYIGPREVFENVFARLAAEWDNYTCVVRELHEAGNVVVGLGNYTATHRKTGKFVDARVAHVWRVEDGKAVSFEQFTDTVLFDHAAR
ncbi:nuclear transport factor 2 family protein [Arthrobacter ginkgonis]|uniref:Nuclear transport factor 2 family protein n=1 Tax=Arthrobacter ginkgonis TaxID=1630594 RepID=A0ABP7CYA3_9MICC